MEAIHGARLCPAAWRRNLAHGEFPLLPDPGLSLLGQANVTAWIGIISDYARFNSHAPTHSLATSPRTCVTYVEYAFFRGIKAHLADLHPVSRDRAPHSGGDQPAH